MFKYIVIALFLSGCNYGPDLSLKGDWTPEEVEVIQTALEAWCEKSEWEHCAVIEDDAPSTLELSEFKPGEFTGMTLVNPYGDNEITIYNGRSSKTWLKDLYPIVVHELGHHYRGTGHLPSSSVDVMSVCGALTGELSMKDLQGAYSEDVRCED